MINFIKLTGAQTLDDLLVKLVIGDIYYIENTDNTFIRYFLVPKKKEYVGMKYAEDKASLLSESLEQFVFADMVNLTFTANADTTVKVYFSKNSVDTDKEDAIISLTAGTEKTTSFVRKNIYKFMFDDPSIITSGKVEGKLVDCQNLFGNCTELSSLDVSKLDTSLVTNMAEMFTGCSKLKTLDVSGFNTSSVTLTNSMFYGCEQLEALDVSKWNTDKLEDTGYMFAGCVNLSVIDVSNFNMANVDECASMFQNCSKLTTVGAVDKATGWQHTPSDYLDMFSNCPAKPLPTWYE